MIARKWKCQLRRSGQIPMNELQHYFLLHSKTKLSSEYSNTLEEGSKWMKDSSVHMSILEGGETVAIAKDQILAIVSTSGRDSIFVDIIQEGCVVTCLEWIVFENSNEKMDINVNLNNRFGKFANIAVGTNDGHFFVFSEQGIMLLSQKLHDGCVLNMRSRNILSNIQKNDKNEDFCIVFRDSIVRFNANNLKEILTSKMYELSRSSHTFFPILESFSFSYLKEKMENFSFFSTYQKFWFEKKNHICMDAAIAGKFPPSLFQSQSQNDDVCLISVGEKPTIAVFRAFENKTMSTTAIAKTVVSKVFETGSSMLVSKKGKSTTDKKSNSSSDVANPLLLEKESFCAFDSSIDDTQTLSDSIFISKNGKFMAVTNNMGRIYLIDALFFVVIRVWKGYRNATCVFLCNQNNEYAGDESDESDEKEEEEDEKEKEKEGEKEKKMKKNEKLPPIPNNFSANQSKMFLAIFAPLKQVIEIWEVPNGVKICALRLPSDNFCLIQPSSAFYMTDLKDNEDDGNVIPSVFLQKDKTNDLQKSSAFLLDCGSGKLCKILLS